MTICASYDRSVYDSRILFVNARGRSCWSSSPQGRTSLALVEAVAVVGLGSTVMAAIYFMGAVSEAHLNPAVRVAFAVRWGCC
jgi:glycerol uptake facilitator-like aquaporin